MIGETISSKGLVVSARSAAAILLPAAVSTGYGALVGAALREMDSGMALILPAISFVSNPVAIQMMLFYDLILGFPLVILCTLIYFPLGLFGLCSLRFSQQVVSARVEVSCCER